MSYHSQLRKNRKPQNRYEQIKLEVYDIVGCSADYHEHLKSGFTKLKFVGRYKAEKKLKKLLKKYKQSDVYMEISIRSPFHSYFIGGMRIYINDRLRNLKVRR